MSQPVECMSYIAEMGNKSVLMADLNAVRKSRLLISFGTSSHNFGTKNASDSLSYLTVPTRPEQNADMFHIIYQVLV